MRDMTPQEFLKKLNSYLDIPAKVETSGANSSLKNSSLETLKLLLDQTLSEYRANHSLITELVNSYNTLKKKYSENNISSIPIEQKKVLREFLSRINNEKNDRSSLDTKILEIRKEIDEKEGKSYRFKKASESTLGQYKKQIQLFSLIKLELSDGVHTFILLSNDIKERLFLGDLDYLKTDTPLGSACLGKKPGDEITFIAPSGLNIQGKILECSLPSLEQMQLIVSALEFEPTEDLQEKVNPFHLQETYGTNTSRHRKGG